jgi:hypothetical protein
MADVLGISVEQLTTRRSEDHDESRLLSLYRRLKEIDKQRALGVLDYIEVNITLAEKDGSAASKKGAWWRRGNIIYCDFTKGW